MIFLCLEKNQYLTEQEDIPGTPIMYNDERIWIYLLTNPLRMLVNKLINMNFFYKSKTLKE